MTDFHKTITRSAAEGAVLVKNEGDTLPFLPQDNVALFGRCQIDYYKSGTGSGGSVHVPYTINLLDGFKKLKEEGANVAGINEKVAETYRAWIKDNPFDSGNGEWASEPWFQTEMELTKDFVSEAAKESNKALFVVGRTAGEDQDNAAKKGSFFLTDTEIANLKLICAHFKQVVLVLNVPNVIDLSYLDDAELKNITAVIFTWQGGMTGGLGAAEVLTGIVNPSGRLTDTIAKSLDKYPSTRNFGSADDEIYQEDIYVGYRYFTTFAHECVLYPFGYGLSYTTFDISGSFTKKDENTFVVKALVKNTGKRAGREVVQVYAECPQGELGKAKRSLCAFGKTKELQAGESEEIELCFTSYEIASFDDSGKSGFANSYVLEAGEYHFFVGKDVFDTTEIFDAKGAKFTVEKTFALQTLTEAIAPEKNFERFKPLSANGDEFTLGYEAVPTAKIALKDKIAKATPKRLNRTGDKGIKFADVKSGKSSVEDFIAQMDDKELLTLVRGEGMMSRKVASGVASAFGGLSPRLHDHFGLPAVACSDGPSGLRRDNGLEASLVPIGTLLACTWDEKLVEAVYEGMGEEMKERDIDILLGPGCNIHRNLLNGRNFEYFSEDPLITGKMAAAVCRGLAKKGAIGTLKHFALNNQESHRRTENSVASARAIREIYLRGFEIAVKEGGALSIMTSYNGVNSHWSASNFDLCTTILRGEWGYKGFVMTDWWASMNDCVSGGKASVHDLASMVKARNDVYMVVPNDTAESGGHGDNLESSIKDGSLDIAFVEQCALDIVSVIKETLAAKNPLRPLKDEIRVKTKLESVPADAKFYKIGERINLAEAPETMYFKADRSGDYNIGGIFFKDGGNTLSQSITNILVNGEALGSFECRSTGGKNVNQTAVQLYLDEGVYSLKVEHTKPGITVSSLMVLCEKDSPVTAGWLK